MTPTEPVSISTADFSGPGIVLPPVTAASGAMIFSQLRDEPVMSPDHISYAARVHPGLRTKKPFAVEFTRVDDGFTACVPELEEYGLGASRSEALDDLGRTLAELYFSLEQDVPRLSDDLRSVWENLQAHLVFVPR